MKKLIAPRTLPSLQMHGLLAKTPSQPSPYAWVATTPWAIIVLLLLIGGFGIAALYSAAHGNWYPWAVPHALRFCLGFCFMAGVALIPISFIRRYAFLWWLLAVAVLLLLELIGTGRGSQRWFSIGGFNFQPSEPTKLAVICLLAAYFHHLSPDRITRVTTYIPVLAIILLPFTLVLLQPDLGTSMMLLLAGAAVVFVAGIPRWMIGVVLGLAAAALPLAWSLLYPYQRERIQVFLNPEMDALGAGYQITQSKIALGSGGVFGKGYLQGSQSHLDFIPERQTDFIFTVIGEEFGMLGCLYVIALYTGLILLLIRHAQAMKSVFARLVANGVAAMLVLFVSVNIAMVSGMLPVVGAPLPLISYGGTAMMTVFLGIGMVMSAARTDDVE